MQEFINPHKHITPELAEEIVKIVGGVLVDKERTGIGISTALSNIPKTINAPDILIVPNIITADDKRLNKKRNGGFAKDKRNVIFFYSGSGQKELSDYSNVDLIVCVADSYLHKGLDKIKSRYIFIDEDHTAKIQSGLRVNLYWLYERIKHKTNVTYVTATPYQNDVPDVVIKNTHISHKEIKKVHVSVCHKTTIERLKFCYNNLKTNERILIASNEARKVNEILNELGVKEVRLMSGVGFRSTFLEHSNIIINESASVTIMTTSAFEGHDVDEENTSVFVFQNYANNIVQFLDCQIIQALGRPRKKPKYLHINWGGGNGVPYAKSIIANQNELEGFCEAYCRVFNERQKKSLRNPSEKKESFEGDNFQVSYKNVKMKLGDVRDFIVYDDFNFKNEKRRIARVNYIACDVLRSKLNIYNTGLNDKYFSGRGYEIVRYDAMPYDLVLGKVDNPSKTKNLIWNREHNPDYISKRELIKWAFDFSNKDDFKKVYAILKEYLQDDMPSRLDYFFKDFTSLDDIYDACFKIAKERHKTKVENREEAEKENPTKEFIKKNVFQIIRCFIKYNRPAKKIRAFRDFNPFALSSSHIRIHLEGLFNLKCAVYDITALAPSVIQRLAGDKKSDVYETGENRKKSKIKINTYLNSIYKDNRNSEKIFKKLEETEFSYKSLQLIKDNFYRTGISGLLLNTYTFYEKQIIREAIRIFDNKHLIVTRHDEINVFFEDVDDETFKRLKYEYGVELSKIQCLGEGNWFGFIPEKITKKEVRKECIKTPKLYPNTIQYSIPF